MITSIAIFVIGICLLGVSFIYGRMIESLSREVRELRAEVNRLR